jgi:CpXC motif protein
MSKAKKMALTCARGHAFEADVFRSANVTKEPHLKERILAGRFNVASCPACGLDVDADVAFLYHDMDAGQLVWVYPVSQADQAEAIREKVRRSYEIVGSVLPGPSAGDGGAVVFGIPELIAWLGRVT